MNSNPPAKGADDTAASSVRIRAVPVLGLLQADDVLTWLLAWRLTGHRCALITVVGIEGGAPRTIGAQMAVSETGQYVGYLSGGCLEQAVALEALAAIRGGCNRLVRYGKGSRYLDIRLPCGAALDVYIDQSLEVPLLKQLLVLRDKRSLVALQTDLDTGHSEIVCFGSLALEVPPSRRDGNTFTRAHVPPLKMQLIGVGPSVAAIAKLASSVGLLVEAASPNEGTREELTCADIRPEPMTEAAMPTSFRSDRWTAAVLAFHDHEWEPPLLKELLTTPCYYIGVLGSRTVHANRRQLLANEGVTGTDLDRIHGPIGLIPGAKSCASLAVSVIAEIVAQAKANNFTM